MILDASALLCVLLDEDGAAAVIPILRGANMSAVNVSESCARGAERGGTIAAVLRAIERFEIVAHPFDLDLARRTAELRPATRHAGASLGDRACLALAERLAQPVYTADRRLASLDGSLVIPIRLIR